MVDGFCKATDDPFGNVYSGGDRRACWRRSRLVALGTGLPGAPRIVPCWRDSRTPGQDDARRPITNRPDPGSPLPTCPRFLESRFIRVQSHESWKVLQPRTGGVGSARSGSANPPVRATSTGNFVCNRSASSSHGRTSGGAGLTIASHHRQTFNASRASSASIPSGAQSLVCY
jgi:hypothetical protein